MSIDHYASMDAQRKGMNVRENIGAASLLYTNESFLFPEFEGKDLSSLFATTTYHNLAEDGLTCAEFLSSTGQKALANRRVTSRTLATLTLGGNDLLQAYRRTIGSGPNALLQKIAQIKAEYEKVISIIQEALPGCTLLLSTVFDPTDGTGVLPTLSPAYSGELPVGFLTNFNDHVRNCATRSDAVLADIHAHFQGHGANCGTKENFWYWPSNPIEPSYIGASEIRRVWLVALEKHVKTR